jgi:hypothetical protein
MILPHNSYLLAGLIPNARIRIYPDAAHGFLFQHHALTVARPLVARQAEPDGQRSPCSPGAALPS